jgi:uncharacterized protein (TIGR03066 family)
MKALRWIVVVGLVCLWSSGPAPAAKKKKKAKPKDLIVGKWAPTDLERKDRTLEFTKDGALKIVVKGKGLSYSAEGKYKFTDDQTLEITLNAGKKAEKVTIKTITKSQLVLVDPKGKAETFKKVK